MFGNLRDPTKKRATPTLQLYCDECKGKRHFSGKWRHYPSASNDKWTEDFLDYVCNNCRQFQKTFCLISRATLEPGIPACTGIAKKVGEIPEQYEPLPTNLRSLLGEADYQLFLKGLKCEKQGLGLGAFSYYRRVVENKKNDLIDEIANVAEKTGASEEHVELLHKAAKETQFEKAIDIIKDVIPQRLYLLGHNPLKLLHKGLSIGLHNETDENCLTYGQDMRTVLTSLAERIQEALKGESKIKAAIAGLFKLQNPQQNKKQKSQ